jgi:hypothetical protein
VRWRYKSVSSSIRASLSLRSLNLPQVHTWTKFNKYSEHYLRIS